MAASSLGFGRRGFIERHNVSHLPNPLRRRCLASLLTLSMASRRVLAQTPPMRPLRVVASFSILADLVREIAGGTVTVSTLVGPNADAHVFEPGPDDARRLAEADLVVVNGLGFEGWLGRLVSASGYRGPVVVASQGVPARQQGRAPDPHAWQDLSHGQRYVQNLRDALLRLRPALGNIIGPRSTRYIQELAALDLDVRRRFARIPPAKRRVLTSHDAFGYFGAAYGIEFLSVQGMNTDSEALPSVVAGLIEQIRRQKVRAIFIENITDPRLMERIAKESGASVGGHLYSDALSPPGTEADTYLKLFSHNAATIEAGLGGRHLADTYLPAAELLA